MNVNNLTSCLLTICLEYDTIKKEASNFNPIRKDTMRWYYRLCAWFRRLIDSDVVVSDLAVGSYEMLLSMEGQFTKGWTVFNHRSLVQRGKKTWMVLTGRALPEKFSVVRDGTTNKVAY